MRVIGLDQALRHSGAAVFDGDRFVVAEAFTAQGARQGTCFSSFRNWWVKFLTDHKPDRVALEEPLRSDMTRVRVTVNEADFFGQAVTRSREPMTNMQTLLGLYGVRAVAIEACVALRIPYREVNNQDWRQIIYGRRIAPKGTPNSSEWWKSQAIERCRQLGWKVPSKDAAEACMIAEWLRITSQQEQRQQAEHNAIL